MSKNHSVTHKACSNIALIKYWGKLPIQLPMNPSLSLTLTNSLTQTTWEVSDGEFKIDVYFEDEINKSFQNKIQSWLDKLDSRFEFLKSYTHTIKTNNTFPHSTGIASSASAFAALSKCLASLYKLETDQDLEIEDLSHLARLGSGSACRSLLTGFSHWGYESQEYASPLKNVSDKFKKLNDAILIVSTEAKKVSSSVGHELMMNHRFKDQRVKTANYNFIRLKKAIFEGDFDIFSQVVEDEAMMLHALMMTSQPNFCLLHPNSLILIEKIKDYRLKNKVEMCFTLDAGPNIHLLYTEESKVDVENFLKTECKDLLVKDIIFDYGESSF